jgi:hypothetical protein
MLFYIYKLIQLLILLNIINLIRWNICINLLIMYPLFFKEHSQYNYIMYIVSIKKESLIFIRMLFFCLFIWT